MANIINTPLVQNASPFVTGRYLAPIVRRLFCRLVFLIALLSPTLLPITADAQVIKDLLNPDNNIIKDSIINPDNPVIINPDHSKKLQILCAAPMFPNAAGTKCLCPSGQFLVGDKCLFKAKPMPMPLLCALPFVPNSAGTKCVCPTGKIKIGNRCELKLVPRLNCEPPKIPNSAGSLCVCPPGLTYFQNSCIPQRADPNCSYPFVPSSQSNACVCAAGFRLNSAGTDCVRRAARQPSVSPTTVRQIQACLAVLGFRPGPADGVAGRRTYMAFSQFRRSEGLFNRPNDLADPIIQNRLFKSCANASNKQKPPVDNTIRANPQPLDEDDDVNFDPVPPVDTIITNFDPQTGYPPLQCATAGLLARLKIALGSDLDISICGQSCTPIPPGMTPTQIAATGNNVNWCLTCATVGKELLCSTNPPADD
ncbi:MAG: hypothetical protein GY743_03640 [Planctomycetaceae bacterium]|nr:hypothetical protein [Planctomycetaceae bacterium]